MAGEQARDAILREALRITSGVKRRPVDATRNGNGKHTDAVEKHEEDV